MNFFRSGSKRRKPAVLCNGFGELLNSLAAPETSEDVAKRIREMLECLAAGKDDEKTTLATLLLKSPPVMPILLSKLAQLGFETRKEVAQIFIVLMQRDLSGFRSRHLETHPEVVSHLMGGYADSKTALVSGTHPLSSLRTDTPQPITHRPILVKPQAAPDRAVLSSACTSELMACLLCGAGTMLRESIEFEPLAAQLLTLELLEPFFASYLVSPSFDVGSDAFVTLRSMLTRHKQLSAGFLAAHHDAFFARYNTLLVSDNYVTQRQSLKLLGEILLDRARGRASLLLLLLPPWTRRVLVRSPPAAKRALLRPRARHRLA